MSNDEKFDKINQSLEIVARIHTVFPTKFGIPRQSNLVDALEAMIVFEPEYRNPEALRGIEDYTYLWLLWGFSENKRTDWTPTVRPPRLGGNKRMGVFATRSPYRPNRIGLSSVRLVSVEEHPEYGRILNVAGADLMDGTPIYDIKPYLTYTDSHPDAKNGFAGDTADYELKVLCSQELMDKIPERMQAALLQILSQDPRPSYQNDPMRVYGFFFGEFEILFNVNNGVLTVQNIKDKEQ